MCSTTSVRHIGQMYSTLQFRNMGFVQKWSEEASNFQKKQVRIVLGIKLSIKITKKKLYEITGNKPLPITIAKRRCKLLVYILRMPPDCPARKSRRHCFEIDLTQNLKGEKQPFPHKTLKYWVGVQRGQPYLIERRCLFSLGWPPF